uniref:Uncharacterized protein n=1 Tax=Panagrolaimus sp. PS1159 TaxID=55785 RepID=A0AC35GR26_9BILA
MWTQRIFIFLSVLLSFISGELSKADNNIVTNLKRIFQDNNDFTDGDIFCYCNHLNCDEEVKSMTNDTYHGICRVYGNCRRTEVRGNNSELTSLILSCIPQEELIPPMRPFPCQTSKYVKNRCCESDLCLPQEKYFAIQQIRYHEEELKHQHDLQEEEQIQKKINNELLVYGFL